ncbi:MAG: 1,4-alpha-glucan branching protein domain-containing protein [Verrucomicrobiota bacterium]
MSFPSVSLLLSAQLPFTPLRERGSDWSAGEIAFFRALSECYLPLFDALQEIARRHEPPKPQLTIAISPVLVTMLEIPRLRQRYSEYLLQGVALAEEDLRAYRFDGSRQETAQAFRDRFVRLLKRFTHDWREDVLAPLKDLSRRGLIEMAGAPATPAILPLLSPSEGWLGTQIEIGQREIERAFGRKPRGFLLPDGAYCAELDPVLSQQGVEWIALESNSTPPGVTMTPSGVKVLWTQREITRSLWDATSGFSADAVYRHCPPTEISDPLARANFGMSYGRRGAKSDAYRRGQAMNRMADHADEFAKELRFEHGTVGVAMPMETFGHGWCEGVAFLQTLFSADRDLTWITPTEAMVDSWVEMPGLTSSGRGRTLESWVGDRTLPVFPHLYDTMSEVRSCARALAPLGAAAQPTQTGALAQMIREILLAQSGDCLLFLQNSTGHGEFTRPMVSALLRLRELIDRWKHGRIESDFLGECFRENPLFPQLDWRTLASAP